MALGPQISEFCKPHDCQQHWHQSAPKDQNLNQYLSRSAASPCEQRPASSDHGRFLEAVESAWTITPAARLWAAGVGTILTCQYGLKRLAYSSRFGALAGR
jgi:hypothetical protein